MLPLNDRLMKMNPPLPTDHVSIKTPPFGFVREIDGFCGVKMTSVIQINFFSLPLPSKLANSSCRFHKRNSKCRRVIVKQIISLQLHREQSSLILLAFLFQEHSTLMLFLGVFIDLPSVFR